MWAWYHNDLYLAQPVLVYREARKIIMIDSLQNFESSRLGRYRTASDRVARVREKYLENEFFSRSGKSQGILWMVRKI